MFEFYREQFNKNFTMRQNQLYVEYGTECTCDCPFCRNKTEKASCVGTQLQKVDKVILKKHEYCKRIIFGGGEPLLHIDRIVGLIKQLKKPIPEFDIEEMQFFSATTSFHLVTNGSRDLYMSTLYTKDFGFKSLTEWFEYNARLNKSVSCSNCHYIDKIIISRHHYEDQKNKELFGTNTDLLTCDDLANLCVGQKRKIQLYCVCQVGGIESEEEIFNYINWAINLGYRNVLFSNLDGMLTPSEVYQKKNVNSRLLEDVFSKLKPWHNKEFDKIREIYTSSGYRTRTIYISTNKFTGDSGDDMDIIRISFKEWMDCPKCFSKDHNYNFEHTVHADGSVK